MLTTLTAIAAAYGPAAVTYVVNNAWWLVPLGAEAINIIVRLFS